MKYSLFTYISLWMIPHKRRESLSLTFSMSFNVEYYIYKNRCWHESFFIFHFGHFIAMIVTKAEESWKFLFTFPHTRKQCAQSFLWIIFFIPCIFLTVLTISQSSLETLIFKLSFELISFPLLITLIMYVTHISSHSLHLSIFCKILSIKRYVLHISLN